MSKLENWLKEMIGKEVRHAFCEGTKSDFQYCSRIWTCENLYCRDLEDGMLCANINRETRHTFYPVEQLELNLNYIKGD